MPDIDRGKAAELVVQVYLAEYNALRQQVIEWTRVQYLTGTTVLAAGTVAFAFLADRSRVADPTIFLVLPLLFAFFGGVVLLLARSNLELASYFSVLRFEVRSVLRRLDPQLPTDNIIGWEEFKRRRHVRDRAEVFVPWLPLFQSAAWALSSTLALGLFFDRESGPSAGQGLMVAAGVCANIVLVALAFLLPRSAETTLEEVRRGYESRPMREPGS